MNYPLFDVKTMIKGKTVKCRDILKLCSCNHTVLRKMSDELLCAVIKCVTVNLLEHIGAFQIIVLVKTSF